MPGLDKLSLRDELGKLAAQRENYTEAQKRQAAMMASRLAYASTAKPKE